MTLSPFSRQTLSRVAVILHIILVLVVFRHLFHASYPLPIPGFGSSVPVATVLAGNKAAFVQQVLDTEIDGPFDSGPLRDLCKTRKWTNGLIVKCMPPPGGVGNVRNIMLNCLRFAFEAGATGLVVPEIIGRGADLSEIRTDVVYPFTHFFDLDHFMSSLTSACPQIHIYSHENDAKMNIPSTPQEVYCNPQKLSTSFHPVATTVIAAPGNWSSTFHGWLNKTAAPFSAKHPVVVTLYTPLLRFPLNYDDPLFVATFGRILRIRRDVRGLAASVLYAMSQKYLLALDFSKHGVQEGIFYGAHLRTAKDAAAVGWPGYEEQSRNYLDAARQHNLSLIYLTSGNPADTVRFADAAANLSIAVTTKTDLLAGEEYREEKAAMEKLSWDQRGMIDYEVLLRSSVFGGMFESSFSWNVAMKRHVVVGNGTWEPISYGKQGVKDKNSRECFMDALSAVFGPVELGIRWNFPLALWP